jgi:hypothetical protein
MSTEGGCSFHEEAKGYGPTSVVPCGGDVDVGASSFTDKGKCRLDGVVGSKLDKKR